MRGARHPDHEGNAQARLVGAALLGPSVFAEGQPIVRGEHDDRVGEVTTRADRVHDPGDRIVDPQERRVRVPSMLALQRSLRVAHRCQVADPGRLVGDVGLPDRRRRGHHEPRERPFVPGRRHPRRVWRRRGEPEEVGPIGRCLADEVGRLLGEDVGRVVGAGVSVADDVILLEHRVVVVQARHRTMLATPPPVPPGRHERRPLERVQVQVLADQSGVVARGPQPRRERRAVVEQVCVLVVSDAGVV
jgi:hypothetical protein